MATDGPVLVSWCARNNDPYERDREGQFQLKNGQPVPGPTLTLLYDQESQYCRKIRDVVLFYNESVEGKKEPGKSVVQQTITAIEAKGHATRCESHKFITQDPTDHQAIFQFLRARLPEIREKYRNRELVIHISPGTPSMQTIWVLMAECGFLEPPFTVVKSYRPGERKSRTAVVPVNIGIETFYKVYRAARPAKTSFATEEVFWDPARFCSTQLTALYAEARRFAQLRVPVLITGERGTGKTTLAGWMRLNSAFCKPELNRNWASVPCGQYGPETMRSELFGYVKGAFTGANSDHRGLVGTADGDTLFLDEIGDISRDVQRLLIRTLEEGTYQPLGSTRQERSTFRLIAATNLELSELQRRLDPDFFDRISALQLRVPALRELPEDLGWLWESTFQMAAKRCGLPDHLLSLREQDHESIAERLKSFSLDGNLRDLLKVSNRLVASLYDQVNPLSNLDAIEYALNGLELSAGKLNTPRAVAQAFFTGQSLDRVLSKVNTLNTKEVEQSLHRFIAIELRRFARLKRIEVEELCDVSSRTLRDWAAIEES
jgi:DNA-binding NtrC family response regulator